MAAERLISLCLAGRGSLLLLAGAAGIGKTTLADWIAARAERRGADVRWGRAWESGGAPAYWPFVQALRSHHERIPAPELDGFLQAADPSLGRLLPELASRMQPLPEGLEDDAEAARFRLFAAVAEYLRWGSSRRPLVLALDDLHAADSSSMLLLDFVASELAAEPVLLLAAYRNEDAERSGPFATGLERLLRHPNALRVDLDPLSRSDVAEYVTLVMGVDRGGLGERVFSATEGHPLFVREYVQLLLSQRTDAMTIAGPVGSPGLPGGIRALFAQRLDRLPSSVLEVLAVASVLGREFDADVAAAVAGMSSLELLSALQPAIDERIVTEVPAAPGRLRFTHALLRDAVYETMPLGVRMQRHLQTADALEIVDDTDSGERAAELAHHVLQAGQLVPPARAVAQARKAGDHALEALAYEEAAEHYAAAVAADRRAGAPDVAGHCDLLLALGDAAARAGRGPVARTAFSEAADLAMRHRLAERAAKAALGYSGRFVWARAGKDRRLIVLLRRALATVAPDDSTLRVRLLARLAGALRDELDRSPRDEISREALEMARRLAEPEAIAHALDGRCAALLWADNARERLDLADELVSVAEANDLHERAFQGHYYRALALMELGDLAAMRRELGIAEQIVAELRLAPQLWLLEATRATLALFEGRFDDADRLIERALATGRDAQASDAELSYALQRAMLARERGRSTAVEALIRRAEDAYPARSMFPALLAAVALERGHAAEARRRLREMAVQPKERLGWTTEWTFTVAVLAEVAAALPDPDAAAPLYDALLPLAGLNAATSDEVSAGSVERSLGLLAGARGRWPEAVGHLERAVAANERMGARPWVAHSMHDLARALTARNGPGDQKRAIELCHEVRRTCSELDMPKLDRATEATLRELRAPLESSERAADEPILRREGDVWSVAFGAETGRIRHTIGMTVIARLISEPSREIHALDLSSGRPSSDTAPPDADAGPLLDRAAKAAYRDKLAALDVEIERARREADPSRAGRLNIERRALDRELRRAVGLGHRDRRAARTGERARVSVTRAVRLAITRIGEQCPRLGAHLQRAIRTGTYCVYLPEHGVHRNEPH